MKKALKICVGIVAIGYIGSTAFAVGEALPMVQALYKGDCKTANLCAAAIRAVHGRKSGWYDYILDCTVFAVNTILKIEGNERRVEHRK